MQKHCHFVEALFIRVLQSGEIALGKNYTKHLPVGSLADVNHFSTVDYPRPIVLNQVNIHTAAQA